VSDSDLRQALLAIWRLISCQEIIDGTVVKPLGDNPQGYLFYTPDGHVFVQFATRAQRVWPPRPEGARIAAAQPLNRDGFSGYCGTFEVREGQAIHHIEFGLFPRLAGSVEPHAVAIDGDRLTLGTPSGRQFEWLRVD
jgi:hypothetical protein